MCELKPLVLVHHTSLLRVSWLCVFARNSDSYPLQPLPWEIHCLWARRDAATPRALGHSHLFWLGCDDTLQGPASWADCEGLDDTNSEVQSNYLPLGPTLINGREGFKGDKVDKFLILPPYNGLFPGSPYGDAPCNWSLVCLPAQSFSHVWLFATPWTVAPRASLSMGFSRQQYWTGLSFLSPGDLPDPVIEPVSPALAGRFSTTELPAKP